jgi:membrane dipeptidase
MIIIDAHEDLAFNVMTYGRDYTRSVAESRQLEAGTVVPERNGETLIGWPDWIAGGVGVVFSTLFATPLKRMRDEWETVVYPDSETAYKLYRAQLDLYWKWAEERPELFALLRSRQDLDRLLAEWERFESGSAADATGGSLAGGEDAESTALVDAPPVGLVVLMEGADGVRSPEELPEWYEAGVRIIGPAWAATRYAGGTNEPGGFTEQGWGLLEWMAELGICLDLSHLAEQAALEALGEFQGEIVATHSNARALLKGYQFPDRQLSDEVILKLAERGGVIGIVPYSRFLKADWDPEQGRDTVGIEAVVAHIDHVCQLVGDADHVGIGTDFDGGFGLDQVPNGLDSVADLRLIGEALQAYGYSDQAVEAILGGNWLKVLRRILPQ